MADTTRRLLDAAGIDGPQHVPVNMYETAGRLVVVAPLPGVMADDITVTVEDGRLDIRAAMRSAAPKDYILHEWHYGPYERSVDIPSGYGAGATASFGNGQLAISLAKGAPENGKLVVSPA